MRKYQKSSFILPILDGVWGLFLIQTFLKNRDPPLFQNSQIEIGTFFFNPPPPPLLQAKTRVYKETIKYQRKKEKDPLFSMTLILFPVCLVPLVVGATAGESQPAAVTN